MILLHRGTPFTGVLDMDANGMSTQGGAFQVGVFTVDVNTGRGFATALPSSAVLPDAGITVYIVSEDQALVLETDSTRVLTGELTRQY